MPSADKRPEVLMVRISLLVLMLHPLMVVGQVIAQPTSLGSGIGGGGIGGSSGIGGGGIGGGGIGGGDVEREPVYWKSIRRLWTRIHETGHGFWKSRIGKFDRLDIIHGTVLRHSTGDRIWPSQFREHPSLQPDKQPGVWCRLCQYGNGWRHEFGPWNCWRFGWSGSYGGPRSIQSHGQR